jgi:hemerythrin
MALINWSDSFSVNVSEIDLQHKKLVTMINELSDAMKQGRGKDIMGKIVTDLINYALTHFITEEKYFDKFGYPETDSHNKEHTAFAQRVSDFKEGFENGRLSLSIEVLHFLSDWLQNHIKGTDKKYSQFFNEKGLR